MDKIYKDVLQITKEIVVKFVEVGRITPANFAESFPAIYAVVRETLTVQAETAGPEAAPAPAGFLLAESAGQSPGQTSGPVQTTPAGPKSASQV